ncbi:vWA domain-containing protein [Urbifossiella limnaea]|uniref:Chromosome partition protein Smc n=1 Tax=Urbifossiella limnaea TaxID=2528023 RepID=A0A517XVW5_9BACT|nr:vWA domain-containing protein [Urbifossiella limnaea]QDU21655.1 Chromosome partition protein Smc [Urbifossiella limnaea]
MRVRHKQPTLVSMWMLDVFCCALGCVTLLWLLNTRQATEQTTAAQAAFADLSRVRDDLKLALTNLDSTKLRLNSEVKTLTKELGAVRVEKADLARNLGIARDEAKSAQELLDATKLALNATEKKLDATANDLILARKEADDADLQLRRKQKEAEGLARKAAASAAVAEDLARLVRTTEEERVALERRAAELKVTLADLDARLASSAADAKAMASKSAADLSSTRTAAEKAATDAAAAKAAASKADTDLLAARGQIRDMRKQLDEANATIIDLQGEKAKLADKTNKLDPNDEKRFAGISMTGRNVVFLVDTSGSMEKTDSNTAAPMKWPNVCDTIARVMRSVPTIQQYQVIVFSKDARWLLGSGEWRRYDGEKSVAEVREALGRIRPADGTNMHAGFDLAFGLRPRGLDTIYLFSDGLPNIGPGLTPAQVAAVPPLEETRQAEIMGRFIRDKLRSTWNPSAASRIRIHSIGFYYESPDLGAFLWALARENDGSFVGMSRP